MNTKTVTSAEFNDECNGLRSCIGSLKGCLANEIPNETRILRSAISAVEAMKLPRRNPLLEERRTNLLRHAREVIEQRVERSLSADIFEGYDAAVAK